MDIDNNGTVSDDNTSIAAADADPMSSGMHCSTPGEGDKETYVILIRYAEKSSPTGGELAVYTFHGVARAETREDAFKIFQEKAKKHFGHANFLGVTDVEQVDHCAVGVIRDSHFSDVYMEYESYTDDDISL